jgi:LmbE family N-acetylglucosaminyl deacetylase
MTEATERKRALVIGAHPDDNEFGAGATTAKLAAQGWDVTFIIVTNGNKGSHDLDMSPYQLSATREQEQRAAAAALGVQRVLFLRNNDGELESTFALRAEIALYIRHFKPHRVLTSYFQ